MQQPPSFADVLEAAARIVPHVRVTALLQDREFDLLAGAQIHFKCEHLQVTGSFKARGALNAVLSLEPAVAAAGVLTHSSGNHGAALAYAARVRGIPVDVVVPIGARDGKVARIKEFGATVHRCEPTTAARDAALAELAEATGKTVIHPYANTAVMAGQGTIALELATALGAIDDIVVPLGGGGLSAGIAIALAQAGPDTRLVAVEPLGAAEAQASVNAGRRVLDWVPDTQCDGLRATIGEPNLAVLIEHDVEILTVSDPESFAALRLIARHLHQIVEPSAAVSLAAVLSHPKRFAGRRVAVVLTGGNLDNEEAAALLQGP